MKEIKLTQGKYALVDDEDFDVLSKNKWSFCKIGYAERRSKGKLIRMHRQILDAPTGKMVDHINMNGLDNRRSNLRLCTKAENMRNRNKTRANKSGYKGVYLESSTGKWVAQIRSNGVSKKLGRFKDIKEAAKAYDDVAALIEFGEFSRLNTYDIQK